MYDCTVGITKAGSLKTGTSASATRISFRHSKSDLAGFRVKSVEHATKDTYVVTNNHFLGKAVVNALEIASVLRGQPVPVPPPLLAHYPELRDFARKEEDSGQLLLLPD